MRVVLLRDGVALGSFYSSLVEHGETHFEAELELAAHFGDAMAAGDVLSLEYHVGLLRLWREPLERHGLPAPAGYGPPGVGRAVFSVSSFMDAISPDLECAALPHEACVREKS